MNISVDCSPLYLAVTQQLVSNTLAFVPSTLSSTRLRLDPVRLEFELFGAREDLVVVEPVDVWVLLGEQVEVARATERRLEVVGLAAERDLAVAVEHDVDEVRRRLSEIALPPNMQHQLVRAAVELGLGRGDAEREWVSQLISQLYGAPVGRVEVAKGFEALLARADDLTLDHPNAAAILAAFTVRAVADDCLPPAFVCTLPPAALCTPKQLEAYTSARAQLTTSHFSDRRRHVWGPGAAASVETLKAEVAELLKEYLLSGEEDEAVRCVRALHAPAFGHEVVKRAVTAALPKGDADRRP